MSGGARRAAERRGRRGETFAALFLMAKGYEILAQRARTPFGEIDLVARKAGLLVIVEVKARPSRVAGLEAILPRQKGRLERAALWFAAASGQASARLRFDLIIVRPWALPVHVEDAWRVDPN